MSQSRTSLSICRASRPPSTVPATKLTNATIGGGHVDARMRDEPEAEEDDVSGHVGDEHVAEREHADRVDDSGRKRQQQQADDRQSLGDRGLDGHGLGSCSYSCGVRSNDVTVDMRVISHFASLALHRQPVGQVPQ